jgi:hypothetical protein
VRLDQFADFTQNYELANNINDQEIYGDEEYDVNVEDAGIIRYSKR